MELLDLLKNGKNGTLWDIICNNSSEKNTI